MNTYSEDLPLSGSTIIRTSDREEALRFATEAVADMSVDYRQGSGHFEYHLAADSLGSLDVMAMEMHIGGGADFSVEGIDDAYVLELPIMGQSSIIVDGIQKTVSAKQNAVIHGPAQPINWRDPGFRYRALSVRVPGQTLRKRLTQYAGLDGEHQVAFEPFVDLQTPGAMAVCGILGTAIELLEQRQSIFAAPANAVLFEEFVANCFLTALPNSASELLSRPVLTASAAAVRRVEDFVEANLDEAITVADLAEVAGVSVRSLQRAFQEQFSVSPLRYIRDKRLDRARLRLMSAGNLDTVSQIAFASGFTHLGQFGAEYKRRFGETPSETLAKS